MENKYKKKRDEIMNDLTDKMRYSILNKELKEELNVMYNHQIIYLMCISFLFIPAVFGAIRLGKLLAEMMFGS
jgi:hypothetical protein